MKCNCIAKKIYNKNFLFFFIQFETCDFGVFSLDLRFCLFTFQTNWIQ